MDGIGYSDARGPDAIRLYAVGDVHGRLDLLRDMHGLIRADLDRRPVHDWRIIHLGDYIDRGPQSGAVLDFLIDAGRRDSRVLSLLGNHDQGFLHYLATGDTGGIFAHNGGAETALSYGVEIDFSDAASAQRGYAAMIETVPKAHVDFIRRLPRAFTFGDFFFCHAGIDPTRLLDAQKPDDLIWMRDPFLDWRGLLEKVIVHGHTPQDAIDIRPNRVNLDTAAWKSGILSAIVIDGAHKDFIQAER